MKNLRTLIALAALLALSCPASAQWQVSNHSVPVGRGSGVQGFGAAAPGTAGFPLVSNGANVDPSFQQVPISTGVGGLGANVATFLGAPTSANLRAALTDETGTGPAVFGTSPALTGIPTAPTPIAGTNTTQIATTAFVQASVTPCTTSGGFLVGTGSATQCSTVANSNAVLSGFANFSTLNAVFSNSINGATPTLFQMAAGSAANPITSISPTVAISRYEAINQDTEGGQNAALLVNCIGNDTSNIGGGILAQTVCITAAATQIGSGDVAGAYFTGNQNGTLAGRYAYGIFAAAQASKSSMNAIAAELVSNNSTGSDASYSSGSAPSITGIHILANGAKLNTTAIYIDGASLYDVGIAFRSTSVKTASIEDDSAAVTSFKMYGTHTNGLDTTSGTFSGKAILGTGYSIDGTGALVASSVTAINATTAILSAQSGGHTALFAAQSVGGVNLGTATADILSFITNNVFRGTISASAADWSFGTSGNQGTLSLFGSSSGSSKIVPVAAASGVATLPAGTFNIVGDSLTQTLTNKSIVATQLTGTLQAGQFPALTGDITTTAGALATTLATVNASVGSFGSATQSGTFTVNAKGLLTAAANVTITPAIGSVTGLGTGVGAGLANAINTNTGFLTGTTASVAAGAIKLGAGSTVAETGLADVATGALLASGGVGSNPTYCLACTITTSLTVPSVLGAAGAQFSLTAASGQQMAFGASGTSNASVFNPSGNAWYPQPDATINFGFNTQRWATGYFSGQVNAGAFALGANLVFSGTAPTITSGFGGGSPTISAPSGTAGFRVTIGTASGSTGVLAMPTAANNWVCSANHIVGANISASNSDVRQTANSATSVTLTNYSDIAGAATWVAGDVIGVQCAAL